MPDVIEPMLAGAGPLQSGNGWAFEFKYDGVRAVSYVDHGRVRVLSRNADLVKRSANRACNRSSSPGPLINLDRRHASLNEPSIDTYRLLSAVAVLKAGDRLVTIAAGIDFMWTAAVLRSSTRPARPPDRHAPADRCRAHGTDRRWRLACEYQHRPLPDEPPVGRHRRLRRRPRRSGSGPSSPGAAGPLPPGERWCGRAGTGIPP